MEEDTLKRTTLFALATTIIFSEGFSSTLHALPPGLHSYVAKQVLNKLKTKFPGKLLEKSEEEAFIQGNILADVGRIFLDAETKVESDGKEFIGAVTSVAKTKEEKYFALGLNLHEKVDARTSVFLRDIFGKPERAFVYLDWYGILDNYLINKTGEYLALPDFDEFSLDQLFGALPHHVSQRFKLRLIKNLGKGLLFFVGGPNGAKKYFLKDAKKDFLVSYKYNSIIKRAYLKAANCDVSDEELKKQIQNLVGACILLCVNKRNFLLSADFIKKLDNKIEELVNILVGEIEKDFEKI